jgi:hypothetical protein
MNLPMWNPALMNFVSLARDSSTREYRHVGFSVRGMLELPPREAPLVDPSPKDRGLRGEVLGGSVGYGLGGAPAKLGLRAALVEGDGAPPALGEL